MGRMLLVYISKCSNHKATRKCDTNGEHDHEHYYAHIYKKIKSKPLTKSSRTKQSHKSSYTIPKGPLDERCGECAKI